MHFNRYKVSADDTAEIKEICRCFLKQDYEKDEIDYELVNKAYTYYWDLADIDLVLGILNGLAFLCMLSVVLFSLYKKIRYTLFVWVCFVLLLIVSGATGAS